MDPKTLRYRTSPLPTDAERIREIIEASDFFSPQETEIACELVQERLTHGIQSGYRFLFAETEERVLGYTCYGPIPCTRESYDLYWIAVDPCVRGTGLGRELLRRSEKMIEKMGGSRIYVETSSRDLYKPTRAFYEVCGYGEASVLKDFYAPEDHKVTYLKILTSAR